MKHVAFVVTMGFALFAMHFGSGNLVYPLQTGALLGESILPALLGLIVTAVGFPAIGFLTLAEIKVAHQAIAKANLGAIEDGNARSSIEQIIGWFRSCLESQRDLVCFYA